MAQSPPHQPPPHQPSSRQVWDPPAAIDFVTIEQALSLGRFRPASVQRSFVWERDHALQVLTDLDKVFSQLYAPPVPEQPLAPDPAEIAGDGADEPSEPLVLEAPEAGALGPALAEEAPVTAAGVAAPARDIPAPQAHYFLGTVVLSPRSQQEAHQLAGAGHGAHELDIYDGLQRFTTLTILAAVLRDLTADPALARRLDRLVTEGGAVTEGSLITEGGGFIAGGRGGRFRLAPTGLDTTLADHVQPPGATLVKRDIRGARLDISRRILQIKNTLVDQIQAWSDPARIDQFAIFLLENVWLSTLTVVDTRLARQIFVSTNLHGKPLDLLDVLKGQLGDLARSEDEAEIVVRCWDEIKELSSPDFEPVLRAIDGIERGAMQGSTWPTDLGAHLATAAAQQGIGTWMRRARSYAHAWKDMQRILRSGGNSRIEQDIWRLHVFWWPEWHPIALRWWTQVQHAIYQKRFDATMQREYQRRFDWLHRRCMAMTLARFSVAARQKTFSNAMQQVNSHRDPLVDRGALTLTPDQRLKIARTINGQIETNEIWAPLMRWLEILEWRPGLPHLVLTSNTEHLLAQNPKAEGLAITGGDSAAYDDACYSIGNLAVIGRRANDRMVNKGFADKLAILTEEAAQFRLLHDVIGETDWGPPQITRRAATLRTAVWTGLKINPPA